MQLLVSVRMLLIRRRWIYWCAAIAVATVVGWSVHERIRALDDERRSWAETREVLVAVRDHDTGDVVEASAVELPVIAVPATAVAAVEAGTRVRNHVAAGAVLVEGDLSARAGPGSIAPSGTLTIGVRDLNTPTAALGGRVHVLSEGVVLSDAGMVVGVVDDVISVAVPERDAPAVAAAAHADLASLGFEP